MDHGHDMDAPPPMMSKGTGMLHPKMMQHMTLYWGKEDLILFHGWPGSRDNMYVSALVFVFVLGFAGEWLSHVQLIKPGAHDIAAGLVQTLMYALRVGLAYLVMLALMSFNGGVFLAAVTGHTLGFLCFESRIFKRSELSYLPLKSC